jgi:hypothetical protein
MLRQENAEPHTTVEANAKRLLPDMIAEKGERDPSKSSYDGTVI